MAHQMKNLCGFSVFHSVEGAFGVSSGGAPKMKMGPRKMNSKMVVVVVGPSLSKFSVPCLLKAACRVFCEFSVDFLLIVCDWSVLGLFMLS